MEEPVGLRSPVGWWLARSGLRGVMGLAEVLWGSSPWDSCPYRKRHKAREPPDLRHSQRVPPTVPPGDADAGVAAATGADRKRRSRTQCRRLRDPQLRSV